MNSPEYYLRIFKLLNNLMTPNKLYNARSLRKLMLEIEPKVSEQVIKVTLTYARANGLIFYDCDYTSNITYWKKPK